MVSAVTVNKSSYFAENPDILASIYCQQQPRVAKVDFGFAL
jgi:hypothetical protein